MKGVLIIDKPAGITSHDVVARVRRILQIKRVGHTGTLDPFATGVMVVLVGAATRLAQFLDKDEKAYEAVVRLGFETDSGDVTGVRAERCELKAPRAVTSAEIEQALTPLRGNIEQTPPMYSAKKIAGKKLYEHARQGETVVRKAASVTIHRLELTQELGAEDPEFGTVDFGLSVICSAGTYIRTLAEEIGRHLGTGAHLAGLRRTRAGKFQIEDALTLEELENFDDKNAALLPIEQAVSHLPKFVLPEDRIDKTRSGLPTRVGNGIFEVGSAIRLIDSTDRLIAVGFYDAEENVLKPKVVLV